MTWEAECDVSLQGADRSGDGSDRIVAGGCSRAAHGQKVVKTKWREGGGGGDNLPSAEDGLDDQHAKFLFLCHSHPRPKNAIVAFPIIHVCSRSCGGGFLGQPIPCNSVNLETKRK